LALMTAQMALGIATLMLGAPPALSLLHRICGVLLLAAAFALVSRFRSSPDLAARSDANFGFAALEPSEGVAPWPP